MKLITTDAQLRALIPNVLVTVTGETSLLDKMKPFLEEAERWLSENFLSDTVLDTVIAFDEDNVTRQQASQIVSMEAFRNAVPFLDVVFTPNGFGIVSNNNIAPASKERVERLIATALSNRDQILLNLVPQLYGIDGWSSTEQCRFFGSTLFPTLAITKQLACKDKSSSASTNIWDQYLQLREELLSIEQFVADCYISTEQMDVFRNEVISGTIASAHSAVVRSLQSVEIQMLKGKMNGIPFSIEHRMLDNIVNVIRNDETNFPEWHSSSVKELFSPPIYKNKKEDCGYWF